MENNFIILKIITDIQQFSEKYIDSKRPKFYLINVYDNFSKQN